MKANKDKFLKLVTRNSPQTLKKTQNRIKNRKRLRVSQEIALDVLERLDELGWKKKDLAEKMGVTPAYVSKIVRGSENLTLETIIKLQDILGIDILEKSYRDCTLQAATSVDEFIIIATFSESEAVLYDKKISVSAASILLTDADASSNIPKPIRC